MTGINLTNFKQPLNYEHFLNIPKVVVVLVHYKIATIKVTRIPVILSLIIGQVILIGVVDKARRWREAVQIERKSVTVAVEVVVLRCLLLVLTVLLDFVFDGSKWTRL
jgi:hypothetical protein